MSDKRIRLITYLISALFFSFCILNLLTPSKGFSETENRALSPAPDFVLSDVSNGSFMKNFESYTTDKFILRDFFVTFKAYFERITGKSENNGVYFGKNSFLIEKPAEYNEQILEKNLNSIKLFSKLNRYNITTAIIPTAFEIESENLPYGAHNDSVLKELSYIKNSFKDYDIDFVDTTELLKEHSNEYLYYKTDHHQTANGSYYIYNALGKFLGYSPYIKEAFNIDILSDDFLGTTWSKAMLKNHDSDKILKYSLKAYTPECSITYSDLKKSDSLYKTEYLNKKDKYSVYLGGNHPVQVVNSSCGGGKKVAILKDSYANSIIPFLVNHFETIHLIDLRYYDGDIIEYLYKNNLKDILILYNTTTFMTDTSIEKLGNYTRISEFAKTAFGTVPETKKVDMSYFSDAAFAGDSLTEGLRISTSLEDYADFYCEVGASLTGASSVENVKGKSGKNVTIKDALTQAKYKKIYIMLGINDGQSLEYIDSYINNYKYLIEEIKKENPDVCIYIQSIMPVTKIKEAKSEFKNFNIYSYNEALRKLAERSGAYYLPVYLPFVDESGYLKSSLTPDGVHLTGNNYDVWTDFLRTHTVPDISILNNNNDNKNLQSKFNGESSLDTEKLFNDLTEGIHFEDKLQKTSLNSISATYGIELQTLSNGAIYRGSGITAEEIAIFESVKEKDVKKIKTAIKKHIDDKKKAYEGYIPKELSKLENPTVVTKGNVVVLCISNDSKTSEKIIRNFLK